MYAHRLQALRVCDYRLQTGSSCKRRLKSEYSKETNMINRRHLLALLPLCAVAVASGPLLAQQGPITLDELRATFEERDANFRKMAQDGLRGNGYYTGPIDGAWGAGTAAAYDKLMASERYRRHAPNWTFARHIQIVETLLFLNSDDYL
jgi:hypothetical protein